MGLEQMPVRRLVTCKMWEHAICDTLLGTATSQFYIAFNFILLIFFLYSWDFDPRLQHM
jgi:hypothetical protein